MDRINHPTATPGRQFTEGDPGSGTPATVVTAQFLNGIQEELVGVIEAAGLSPNAAVVNQLRRAIFELSYPVGSYYWTRRTDLTASQILGFGTWVQLPPGRVPVTLNISETEFNVVGKTGGAKAHALVAAEGPAHTHQIGSRDAGGASANGGDPNKELVEDFGYSGPGAGPASTTSSAGSGQPHNNLQPYVVVGLIWYRTA